MRFDCEKVGLEFFDSAPTCHRATKEIAATPEQIFADLLDADSWVKWAASMESVRAFAEDYQVSELAPLRCRIERTVAMDTGRDPSGLGARISGPIMSFMVNHMLGRFRKLVESHPTLAGVK